MNLYWAYKITETTKSLKVCYLFNTICTHFNIIRRRTETTHQQCVGRFIFVWAARTLLNELLASCVNIYALMFVLEKNILSTCCYKNDVM